MTESTTQPKGKPVSEAPVKAEDPKMTDAEKEAYGKAQRDTYAEANRLLREKYADEFNATRTKLMHEAGYTSWKPAPKPEEKATTAVQGILAGLDDEQRAKVLAALQQG